MTLLSGIVVLGFSLFLVWLGVVAATRPSLAARFLSWFASSARAHYAEQSGRLIVGAAMVDFARLMWFPDVFRIFGWILVITAVGLLLVPWRWHHGFGECAIPMAIRHLKLIALGATTLAALVLYGASRAVS